MENLAIVENQTIKKALEQVRWKLTYIYRYSHTKGYSIRFWNRHRLSVIYGPGSYSGDDTCEFAIFTEGDIVALPNGDTIWSYASPDDLAAVLLWLADQPHIIDLSTFPLQTD